MKHRIIYAGGRFVLVEWVETWSSGARVFMPLGEGATPVEAWNAAFPKPWWKFW